MEWDEEGQLQDLDLALPGRAALGHYLSFWHRVWEPSTLPLFSFSSGGAFGDEEAGEAPGPAAAAESEFAKSLRAAGFPETETQAAPESMTNKILTGIQKRALKMNAAIQNLDPFKTNTLASKILSCFCDTSFSEIVQAHMGLKKLSLLHPRMIEKCQKLKADIEKDGENLSEQHHNGILEGYTQELFGRICYGVWLPAALVIAPSQMFPTCKASRSDDGDY